MISNTSGSTAAEKAAAAAGKSNASRTATDKDGFMKLLMSQMTHQDPLEPMSNQEMMQQMVSIESLDRQLNLEKSIKALNTNLFMTSANLVGKNVTVLDPNDPEKTLSGKVEALKVQDGTANVVIDGKNYPSSSLISVQ